MDVRPSGEVGEVPPRAGLAGYRVEMHGVRRSGQGAESGGMTKKTIPPMSTLTVRELDVIEQLALTAGRDCVIGETLGITKKTAAKGLQKSARKLGFPAYRDGSNRVLLAMWAVRVGLV